MSIVTYEVNSKRKSQRVDIPIYLAIKNNLYQVKDWSIAGIGIVSEKDLGLKPNETLKGTIILPLRGAKLHLDTLIKLKNYRDDIYGFEYRGLTEKNKNVLRHFIQLAIEGKSDNVEDLLSEYSMPEINSPIKDPIVLSDSEKKTLKLSFKKNLLLYLTLGLVLFFFISMTIIYNTSVKIYSKGVVTGNYEKYFAVNSGIIEKVFVKDGEKVSKDKILFKIKENRDNLKLEKGSNKISLLEERVRNYEEQLNSLTLDNRHTISSLSKRVPRLKNSYDRDKKDYLNAKRLYDERVITIDDFMKIENRYLASKSRYEVVILKKSALSKDMNEKLNSKKEKLALIIKEIKLKIDNEKTVSGSITNQINALTTLARSEGVINFIKYKGGEYVNPSNLVMVVETNSKPYILIKIKTKNSMDLNEGYLCVISSPLNRIKYRAKITKVDFIPRDNIPSIAKNVTSKDTILKIEFNDELARLPLNSRVDVWIARDNKIANYFMNSVFFSSNSTISSIMEKWSW